LTIFFINEFFKFIFNNIRKIKPQKKPKKLTIKGKFFIKGEIKAESISIKLFFKIKMELPQIKLPQPIIKSLKI